MLISTDQSNYKRVADQLPYAYPVLMSNVSKFKAMMGLNDPQSRFVGFFLLLQILKDEPESAAECWNVVDGAFLDKLILAKETKSTTDDEALDLRTMGCAILHAFGGFPEIYNTTKFLERGTALMKLYIRGGDGAYGSKEAEEQCGDLLERIASINGKILLEDESYPSFVKKVVDILWIKGYSILTHVVVRESDRACQTLHDVVMSLSRSPAASALGLRLLKEVTSAIVPEKQSTILSTEDVKIIRTALKAELFRPVRGIDSTELLVLFASLLRVSDNFLMADNSVEEQQLFVLVASLSSAEIRSSLASLVDKVHDSKYDRTSTKIASCFDILRLTCVYLVTSEDLVLSPDDILKIRDSLSATFGETISYLRDRWDNSPLCSTSAWHIGSGKKETPSQLLLDPIVLSGSQALCMWLQEDESCQDDASGIMDVLLGLIKEGRNHQVDYESWVQPAIEALLETDKGRLQFAHFDGVMI